MRPLRLARLAAASWALLACSGDDTPSYKFALVDATAPDGAEGGAEAGPPDSGPAHAKILVAHASPNFPAVRWCFAVGAKPDGSDAALLGATPLPDTGSPRGLPRGAGFVLPDVGDLSGVVVPYAVAADKIQNVARPTSCASALAGLTLGGDYERLAPIPAGTFASGKTVLLALTGCLPVAFDPNADAARCGADFSPLSGNLGVRTLDADPNAGQGRLGAQVAHLSSPLAGRLSGAGVAAGLANVPDAGAVFYVQIAPAVKLGQLAPTPAAAAILPSATESALSIGVLDPDGGATPLAIYTFPLPDVLLRTTGQTTGADQYFQNGQNYAFVVLGDPDAGGAEALHAIALPSNPAVPAYP